MTPLALTGWLPVWDLERRSLDVGEVVRWTLTQLRGWGVCAESLDAITADGGDSGVLADKLTRASVANDLQRPLHRALIAALPEVPWDRVWIQTYAHFRILTAGDESAPVPAHTDWGFGHALDERNIWIALSDAGGGGALRAKRLGDSLSYMVESGETHGVLSCADSLSPIEVRAGDALLFTPLHVHAAGKPTRTRVSVDVRIIPRPIAPLGHTFCPVWSATP